MIGEKVVLGWCGEHLINDLRDAFSVRDISPKTFDGELRRVVAIFVRELGRVNATLFCDAMLKEIQNDR